MAPEAWRENDIHQASLWENGYIESSGRELNGEPFDMILKAKVVTGGEYNTISPHSSRGYQPAASEAHSLGQVANA